MEDLQRGIEEARKNLKKINEQQREEEKRAEERKQQEEKRAEKSDKENSKVGAVLKVANKIESAPYRNSYVSKNNRSTLTRRRRSSSRSKKAREKKNEENIDKMVEKVLARMKSEEALSKIDKSTFSKITGLIKYIQNMPKYFFYCDGVGSGYLDGALYKVLAAGTLGAIIWGLNYLSSALLTPVANNAVSKINDKAAPLEKFVKEYVQYGVQTKEEFEKLLTKTCETKIDTVQGVLSTVWNSIMLNESGIDQCAEMEKTARTINYNIDMMKIESAKQAKKWFLVMYRKMLSMVGNIKPTDPLFIKSLLAAVGGVNYVNNLICWLAAKIEVGFKSVYSACTFKQKQDLIKTLSSELRLFDNSLKF
jgi:hypothetical protein